MQKSISAMATPPTASCIQMRKGCAVGWGGRGYGVWVGGGMPYGHEDGRGSVLWAGWGWMTDSMQNPPSEKSTNYGTSQL